MMISVADCVPFAIALLACVSSARSDSLLPIALIGSEAGADRYLAVAEGDDGSTAVVVSRGADDLAFTLAEGCQKSGVSAISVDGECLAAVAVSRDNEVRLLRPDTGEMVDKISAPPGVRDFGATVASLPSVGSALGEGLAIVGYRFDGVSVSTVVGVYAGPAWDRKHELTIEGKQDILAFASTSDGGEHCLVGIGAPAYLDPGGRATGAVALWRVADNSVSWLYGRSTDEWFGNAVAFCDIDADGRPECAIGVPRRGSGVVELIVPDDGTLKQELYGRESGDCFGYSIIVTGDKYDELVVSAPRLFDWGWSYVRLHRASQMDGRQLLTGNTDPFSHEGSGRSERVGLPLIAVCGVDRGRRVGSVSVTDFQLDAERTELQVINIPPDK